MQTFPDYLAALQKAQNISSDYALAKYLGVTRQTVSAYRCRNVAVSIDTAWKIADGLGIDPSQVMAAAELTRAERAHDPERVKVWTARLRQISAACLVVFLGFFHAGDASAAPDPAANAPDSVYYGKSLFRVLARLRRHIRSLLPSLNVRQCRPAL